MGEGKHLGVNICWFFLIIEHVTWVSWVSENGVMLLNMSHGFPGSVKAG
jgi:hypothetical protein